jgi:hypothetical protein
MLTAMAAATLRDRRIAVGLVLGLLLVFYVASIATEYIQAADHGYGTGFSNREHPSPAVVKQLSAEDHIAIPPHVSAAALSNLTLGNHGGGFWHDTWRWILTVIAFVVILAFWHNVISRIGPI